MFEAVLSGLSRTLVLRIAKEWGNIHVIVDISKTTAQNLVYIVHFFLKVLLLAIFS